MELSCTEVPLYGQVTISAKFDKGIYLPEDAEFYFVYDGSMKRHIMFAERIGDNALQSLVPGHGCQEAVSVSVLMYARGSSPVALGSCPVTYRENLSCKLSRFLVSHTEYVSATSHKMLLDKFGLTVKDLQSLDTDLTMAIAHEELPSTWSILGSCYEGEPMHKETLLHLAMKLGLVKLSEFLVGQPGGILALALPNEDGATPLDLAEQNGHSKLVEVFSNFQGSHSPDVARVEISEGACMRFVRSSAALTLTLDHTAKHLLESDVRLFRKYFWNRPLLHESINSNQLEPVEDPEMHCSTMSSLEGPVSLTSDDLSQDDVKPFHGAVVPCKEIEDNVLLDVAQRHSTLDIFKKLKTPPTFFAAARLSTMLNGSDEVYANCMLVDQAEDLKMNYIHGDSISSEMCLNPASSAAVAKSSSSHSLEENDQCRCDPNEGNRMSVKNEGKAGLRPTVSPSDLHEADSYLPFKTNEFIKEQSQLHAVMKKKSSSLDDLEVNSRSESVSDRSNIPYPLFEHPEVKACSRDGLDACEASISWTESLPLSISPQPKECSPSGIRSRSYSCSSPKDSLGRPRIPQDFTVGDSGEDGVPMNSGRSLLQALSLSKSVSLLHPCKRAYSLPEHSREKRIQEEEWDKYIVPSKTESEKYKVSRTFSFLMNRMTSTRNKYKTKNKDTKDKEKLNRHNFINGTFSGVMPCMACEKALLGKESLQCSYCSVIVHKNCKDCVPVCTKKSQERYHSKNKPQVGTGNLSFGDISQPGILSVHPSSSVPIGLSAGRREALQQSHSLSKSVPGASFERRSMPFPEQDSEASTWRTKSRSEEMLQALGTYSSMDSFVMEVEVDSSQWTDISSDAQEFEAESWSLVVDPMFCNKQEKDVAKRQDVIFELMQTEVHHIHTLYIMSEIFRKGMKEELQLDHSTVDRIFPCLDELLEIHRQFFCRLRERRQESCEEGSERNFVISRIGDILVQQFSEENATKMKKIYGEFCSHQKEAVNLFKELQQNKKFQNFIKLRNSNLLARRRGIPECILLVTQRITKYPVLVERILQYTKEGSEEHKDLCKALRLIKDMIAAVDLKVNEYEKRQKLMEILNRTENKTYTKLKSGHIFRKQDLMGKERILLHEGLVYWKTATGRFKDTLALLLTDMLLFLQEKDQKYVFAAVDQKPSVISLQKLIVREVANEERGMFLISASSAGPEMYEVHTNSKEERNSWMRHIQDAVESCPEEQEEGKMGEFDEDRRIAEAKACKIQRCQESLSNQDQQICSCLEDKLRIYAELVDMSGFEDVHVEPHLLVKPDYGETPQAASLLVAALREVESLHLAVTSSQVNETDRSSEESTEELSSKHRLSASEILESFPSDAEMKEAEESPEVDLSACPIEKEISDASVDYKIVQAIQNLTRLLYSIQAALAIQDSHRELHRLLLQENEKTSRSHSSRIPLFLEPEKYRNSEKQRDEMANISKLQQQFQQEQQRWLRECEQWQQEQEVRAGLLEQRERACSCQEELLEKSRQGLALQLQEFQQSLERLQEGQKVLEKKRDSIKVQKKLLWHWKHGLQSNLLLPTGSHEIMRHDQLDSLRGENAFYLNEAVVRLSLSGLNRSDSSLVYEDVVYGLDISNLDMARTCENQVDLRADTSCQPALTNELWKPTGPQQQMSFSCKSNKDAFNNDLNASQIQSPQADSPNHGSIQPPRVEALLLNHQPESLQDTESGDGGEENIVYL
ncbi:rho guanine nucleotide exchange factor 28 isoform X3 [Tympanuchus pallidicinctus]|uniref:rho guanine nucleotide exchange factor 28 isoform X3 n=1 Tax=Tympanuchus pallidicinctus TaxID=109042 RepID=UPI0022876477|nr:rho guanine nucleotide exchange factor 28 isoform X3 [Tympanuchus pallidicinctus]